jgi:hypothetical protein
MRSEQQTEAGFSTTMKNVTQVGALVAEAGQGHVPPSPETPAGTDDPMP